MANWQAVNINTGTTEGTKYYEIGTIAEMWVATLTSTATTGDVVLGPTIPAGTWLMDVKTDWGALGAGATQSVGYTSHTAAFIASGNTTPAAGGIQAANVAATTGFTSTTNTQVFITLGGSFTAASSTKVVIMVTYTANP